MVVVAVVLLALIVIALVFGGAVVSLFSLVFGCLVLLGVLAFVGFAVFA